MRPPRESTPLVVLASLALLALGQLRTSDTLPRPLTERVESPPARHLGPALPAVAVHAGADTRAHDPAPPTERRAVPVVAPRPAVPATVRGRLVYPDGTPVAALAIDVEAPAGEESVDGPGRVAAFVHTGADGRFVATEMRAGVDRFEVWSGSELINDGSLLPADGREHPIVLDRRRLCVTLDQRGEAARLEPGTFCVCAYFWFGDAAHAAARRAAVDGLASLDLDDAEREVCPGGERMLAEWLTDAEDPWPAADAYMVVQVEHARCVTARRAEWVRANRREHHCSVTVQPLPYDATLRVEVRAPTGISLRGASLRTTFKDQPIVEHTLDVGEPSSQQATPDAGIPVLRFPDLALPNGLHDVRVQIRTADGGTPAFTEDLSVDLPAGGSVHRVVRARPAATLDVYIDAIPGFSLDPDARFSVCGGYYTGAIVVQGPTGRTDDHSARTAALPGLEGSDRPLLQTGYRIVTTRPLECGEAEVQLHIWQEQLSCTTQLQAGPNRFRVVRDASDRPYALVPIPR